MNTRIRTALKSLQLFKKLAQLTPRKTVSPISTSLGGPKIKELALHPHLGYILTQKIHHPHTPSDFFVSAQNNLTGIFSDRMMPKTNTLPTQPTTPRNSVLLYYFDLS